MRILLLSNFGMGLYKFRIELLQRLIELNHEVYVSLPNDEYVPKLVEIGCKYYETKVDRRGTNPMKDMKLIKSYVNIIKRIKADIVLTYTIKPNVYGGIACRITQTSYIPNVTGLGTAIENKGVMQKLTLGLYKIGLKKAKCVFFQNEPNRQLFIDKSIVKSETKVLPGSGVNLNQHKYEDYPSNDESIRFLYIGRIMKAKGINELLEAAKVIKGKYSNVQFDIVGFCEEGYAKELDELNRIGTINYHGQQEDIHKFIKNAHATILPSYHEGTSNVLLETASTGRPVLASNVTGCLETFKEGITGFGFEARNVDSLVNTILEFIRMPYEKKKEMGEAGRRKMERDYDRNIVIDAYFEQIMAKGVIEK